MVRSRVKRSVNPERQFIASKRVSISENFVIPGQHTLCSIGLKVLANPVRSFKTRERDNERPRSNRDKTTAFVMSATKLTRRLPPFALHANGRQCVHRKSRSRCVEDSSPRRAPTPIYVVVLRIRVGVGGGAAGQCRWLNKSRVTCLFRDSEMAQQCLQLSAGLIHCVHSRI